MFYYTEDLNDGEIYLYMSRTDIGDPQKNWLPAYYFDICRVKDDVPVGRCDLRIGYNENTPNVGNIGYTVFARYRGNGYAAKACRLMFKQAAKHGMESIYITCSAQNLASRRTCEIAGCNFIKSVLSSLNDKNEADEQECVLLYHKQL